MYTYSARSAIITVYYVMSMSWTCCEHVINMWCTFYEHVINMSWTSHEHVMNMSWNEWCHLADNKQILWTLLIYLLQAVFLNDQFVVLNLLTSLKAEIKGEGHKGRCQKKLFVTDRSENGGGSTPLPQPIFFLLIKEKKATTKVCLSFINNIRFRPFCIFWYAYRIYFFKQFFSSKVHKKNCILPYWGGGLRTLRTVP